MQNIYDLYENDYGENTFIRQSVKNLKYISTNNFYQLSDESIKKLLDIWKSGKRRYPNYLN